MTRIANVSITKFNFVAQGGDVELEPTLHHLGVGATLRRAAVSAVWAVPVEGVASPGIAGDAALERRTPFRCGRVEVQARPRRRNGIARCVLAAPAQLAAVVDAAARAAQSDTGVAEVIARLNGARQVIPAVAFASEVGRHSVLAPINRPPRGL